MEQYPSIKALNEKFDKICKELEILHRLNVTDTKYFHKLIKTLNERITKMGENHNKANEIFVKSQNEINDILENRIFNLETSNQKTIDKMDSLRKRDDYLFYILISFIFIIELIHFFMGH